MSGYRKEWPCCGDETYTEAWEPERCPFCELNDAQDRIAELETELEAARAQQSGEGRKAVATTLISDPFDDNWTGSGVWFSESDWKELAKLPAGTKLYSHPPKAQGVPEGLAETLVDDLFEVGSDVEKEVYRIQFMAGDMYEEKGRGGMNKDALTRWLKGRLTTLLSTTPPADKPEGECDPADDPLFQGPDVSIEEALGAMEDERQLNDKYLPQPEGEWVSVDDELPEPDTQVIVFCPLVDDVELDYVDVCADTGDEWFANDPGRYITHWAKIPTRPAAPDMGGEK